MTSEIMDSMLDHIKPYLCETFTNDSKEFISRLKFSEFNKLFNLYVNQQNITYTDYMIFTINNNLEIEPKYSFDTECDKNSYQVVHQDTKNNIHICQMLNTLQLYETLISNSNKYVFIPLHMTIDTFDKGHATILIFDKSDKSCRLFDSNGMNGYIKSKIMDLLLDTYIDIFNLCHDETYTYISHEIWMENKKDYILNRNSLKTDNIDAGHCMIFTLLIPHLLTITNYSLNTIIKEINKLDKEVLLIIIMSYTQMAYDNYNVMFHRKY